MPFPWKSISKINFFRLCLFYSKVLLVIYNIQLKYNRSTGKSVGVLMLYLDSSNHPMNISRVVILNIATILHVYVKQYSFLQN
jgi:hypothetical protein